MTKRQMIRQAGRLVNKRTLRLFALLGTVTVVCAAVMSALGALLMVRQLQLISAQRKALPVMRRAAEVYLEKNAPEAVSTHRKKPFFLPRPKAQKAQSTAEEETEKEADTGTSRF